MEQDEKFLRFVVESIVDNPTDITITRTVDEMGVLLNLKVNAKDMGQVVGREGNTAKAIRSLLRIVGIKNNARVNLKIEEPEGGKGPNASRDAQVGSPQEPRAPRIGAMDKIIADIDGKRIETKQ